MQFVKRLKYYHSQFSKLRRRTQIFLIISVCFVTLGVIAVVTTFSFAATISTKERIMNRNDTGVTLLDRNGTPFFSFYEAHTRSYVPIDSIAPSVAKAAVDTEDRDFYTHPGFSVKAIMRALYADVTRQELAYGGSTITQQLVKNALLTHKKSFLRKYQEIILAREIENRYTKDQIMEMYLNSVYFGEGAFGIEAAAQTYFGKPAKQLTTAEAAMLIGILPAPSAYSPISGNLEQAYERQHLVLSRMVDAGDISKVDLAQLKVERLRFNETTASQRLTAPHFALMVKDELIKKYGEEKIARSGFKVTTSLDIEWQKTAEQELNKQLDSLVRNQATNGAVVAIDPKTGEIRALVGSRDWYNPVFGKVNMTTSLRQPGSSFKPIVYAAAIDRRAITAASVLRDEYTNFGGGYAPQNYDQKFRGNVLARRALANSLNVPSVEVIKKVGLAPSIEMAHRLGINTLDKSYDYGLSLGLGTAEVRLEELTRAYAVFANAGNRNPSVLITAIKDKTSKPIYNFVPNPQKVLDPGVAYIISSILSDNNARSEIFGNALTVPRPAAVKTGTTVNYRDALTIGYTPSIAVGVWIGNNDGSPMDKVAGSLGPAPIWRALITHFTKDTAAEEFIKPVNVQLNKICSGNGLLAGDSRQAAYDEFFLTGTAPTERCRQQAENKNNSKDETGTNKDKGRGKGKN